MLTIQHIVNTMKANPGKVYLSRGEALIKITGVRTLFPPTLVAVMDANGDIIIIEPEDTLVVV